MLDFLPKLIAQLTGVSRYRPVFELSNSFVCNVFRIYEQIFGRRVGIRCEHIADSSGFHYSYTFENLLATYESAIVFTIKSLIRGLRPRLKIVLVPQLQLAGMRMGGIQPYAFAIAFDVTAFGAQGTSAPSETWTHVVTGSNPNLLVSFNWATAAQVDITSTGTYNGVSMSKLQYVGNGNAQQGTLWYLGNPATGSNSVVINFITVSSNRPGSISYSGCASSIDNSSTQSSASQASPINYSITSVADNCWAVMFISCGAAPLSGGTSTTARSSPDNFGVWFDSNAPKTPAGSITLQATYSGSNDYQLTGATIAPYTASSVNSGFFAAAR